MLPLSLLVVFLSIMAVLEAASFKENTTAANSKATAYQAHNFAEETSEEDDDDDKSISCKNLETTSQAFCHHYSSINDKPPSPFKMINAKKSNQSTTRPLQLQFIDFILQLFKLAWCPWS